MAAKQTKKSTHGRALFAIDEGDRVARGMGRAAEKAISHVVTEWAGAWMNGYEELVSHSRATVTKGYSLSRLLSTSSALTVHAVTAAFNSSAALLRFRPALAIAFGQGIAFEFDKGAEATDPVSFDVPGSISGRPTASALTSPTDGHADIPASNIVIRHEGGDVYSYKLVNLAGLRETVSKTYGNTLAKGIYAGSVTAGTFTIAVTATHTRRSSA